MPPWRRRPAIDWGKSRDLVSLLYGFIWRASGTPEPILIETWYMYIVLWEKPLILVWKGSDWSLCNRGDGLFIQVYTSYKCTVCTWRWEHNNCSSSGSISYGGIICKYCHLAKAIVGSEHILNHDSPCDNPTSLFNGWWYCICHRDLLNPFRLNSS